MKIFIPIKLSSIKKNKNAGQTQTHIYMGSDINFEAKGEVSEFLKDRENCLIQEKYYENGKMVSYEGILLDRCVLGILRDNKVAFSYKENIKLNVINHMPIRAYNFKYEIVDVICKECGHIFKSNCFVELDNDLDEYFESTQTGCPKCGAFDCCEIEYEKIDDVLIRKKNKTL